MSHHQCVKNLQMATVNTDSQSSVPVPHLQRLARPRQSASRLPSPVEGLLCVLTSQSQAFDPRGLHFQLPYLSFANHLWSLALKAQL